MALRSGGGHGGKSNNSCRKWTFSGVKGAKMELKGCHKHMYLESNVFKVQRRACTAHDFVPLIPSWLAKCRQQLGKEFRTTLG